MKWAALSEGLGIFLICIGIGSCIRIASKEKGEPLIKIEINKEQSK